MITRNKYIIHLTMFSTVLTFVLGMAVIAYASIAMCPAGWSEFDRSCYFFSDSKETWLEASNKCIEKGGHLARIDSKRESDYITLRLKASKVDAYRFIDGTDQLDEGSWKWSSSQNKFSFNNWFKGEPNGNTAANCLAIYPSGEQYKWDDVPCTWKRLYLCERDMKIFGNQSCISARELLDELLKCKQGK